MSDKAKQFWMVAGRGPTSARHDTRESAEREAQRLARIDPGTPFFVMEAVSMHRKIDVERVDLRDDCDCDQIPF